jgi:putative oxidoreductase
MLRFYGDFLAGRHGIGILILRLVFGTALMLHGKDKIANPMGWMDQPGKPSPIPDIMQAIAAVSEFGGGLALLLGLLTPLACIGIAATMLGAYFISHRGDPWVGKGGFELASLHFTAALVTLFTGPGVYSLDYLLFKRTTQVSDERMSRLSSSSGAKLSGRE